MVARIGVDLLLRIRLLSAHGRSQGGSSSGAFPPERECYHLALAALTRRYWVITFGTMAILAFVDRVCISQAAPLIARDLGFDKAQMGTVFGAFLLSYGLFEIPGAWYGDLVGAQGAYSHRLGMVAVHRTDGLGLEFPVDGGAPLLVYHRRKIQS
jgi:hypothetical protein